MISANIRPPTILIIHEENLPMALPRVEIGRYGIWYGMIDALSTPDARAAARLVEELGFGALWLAEAVGRDPFASAAVLLAGTETLPVATGIANIYARDPMTMAAGQRTLAEAFPNRFLLGMGVSHGHLVAGVRKHDIHGSLVSLAVRG